MKKSIKWTAVVSTAAVMAAMLPAMAMPVMAAQAAGWTEEDGSLRYYDSDGYVLTDSWKKHNDDWYYLDENGDITKNAQVDEYYVNAEGKRVSDQWVSVPNENYWDEDGAPEFFWYYYGSNGKMTVSKFKTIENKTYYFDDDGRMVTGLQNIDGSNYYFGNVADGAMKKGWVKLETEDDETGDEDFWSYFGSEGKRIENQVDKRINEAYYTFADGKMVTGWYKLPLATAEAEKAQDTDADKAKEAEAGTAETEAVSEPEKSAEPAEPAKLITAAGYQYYDENGKRAAGWMDIAGIPGLSLEDEIYRFYFKSGVPHFAETGVQVFGIGSDRYAFNTKGEMQTGLQVITLADGSTANYYFDASGAMKTGKQSIFDEDLGMNQTWFFQTEGSQRGQGFHGIKNNVIYQNGLRLEADTDLRYAPVTFEDVTYLVNASGTIQKATAVSRSSARPDLGDGYRDVRDSNDTIWTVDVNGVVQKQ